MKIRFALPIAALVALSLPTLAAAQADTNADSSRVSVFTGVGIAGSAELTTKDVPFLGDTSTNDDLGPTPLVGGRFEASLHRFVLIGAQFRAGFARAEDADDRLASLLDFDVLPKARYGFNVGDIVIEPYLAVPVGFSLGVLKDDPGAGLDKTNPGWNIGILPGLTVLTRSGFGGFVEFGWMHHAVYDKVDNDADNGKYSLTFNKFTMHFGATYAF